MTPGHSVVGVAIVMVLLAGTVSAAQGIKEGQWSMTMSIQAEGMGDEAANAMAEMDKMSPEDKAMMQQMMGGMGIGVGGPGMGMAVSSSQCITNAQPVPTRDDQKDCKETHSIEGNTVHFDVVCADSKSSGDVTYEGDSMTGRITSTQRERGQETTSTINLRGQYEGPCRSS